MASSTTQSSQHQNEDVSSGSSQHQDTEKAAAKDVAAPDDGSKHSWRFWLVFLPMCLISLANGLENTIIVTALPTITQDIKGQGTYVWIANSFVIASTAVQPLVGQLSNIFGRRWPLIISTALFILGSGIAGGANGVAMLIAGRVIEGLGSGGIYVLSEVVVCDLVPMRLRGKYLGIMMSTVALGLAIGPIIGGAIAEASWRWVFYINLPVAGAALVAMIPFLRLKHTPEANWVDAVKRIDIFGNFMFIPAITSVLLGLVMGDTVFPWRSANVIVPIIVGALGWALFHVFEASKFCKEPSVPARLLTNRTSVVGFLLAFDAAILLQWVFYFMPLYFQAVRQASPLRAGTSILPLSCFLIPFAMVAGGIMSKTGLYRPIFFAAFAILTIGVGLLSLLGTNSREAAWVWFQIITACGLGMPLASVLPSVQASLPESDVATATGTYSFVRSFGMVWGITIPSVIFNNRVNSRAAAMITDAGVRSQLVDGKGYGFATSGLIGTLSPVLRDQVSHVYADALKTVWQAAIAFAGVGFLIVFLGKHVPLRQELETEYGVDEKKKETDTEKAST